MSVFAAFVWGLEQIDALGQPSELFAGFLEGHMEVKFAFLVTWLGAAQDFIATNQDPARFDQIECKRCFWAHDLHDCPVWKRERGGCIRCGGRHKLEQCPLMVDF